MFRQNYATFALAAVAFACLVFMPDQAFASTATPGGGTGLQWENPLITIVRSITGPVAYAFLVLGLIALGGKLVWGGEMTDFLRGLINFVMVGSLIAFAVGIIGGVMFAGATVPDFMADPAFVSSGSEK